MKYCKDCANFKAGIIGPLCNRGLHRERRESMIDGPYEIEIYDFTGRADSERFDPNGCGPDAKHFLPKPDKPVSPLGDNPTDNPFGEPERSRVGKIWRCFKNPW